MTFSKPQKNSSFGSLRAWIFLLFASLFLFHDLKAQLDLVHYVPPFYARSNATDNRTVNAHLVYLSTPSTDTIPVYVTDGAGTYFDTLYISREMPGLDTLGIGNGTTTPLPRNIIMEDSLNTPLTTQGLIYHSYQPFFVNIRHYAPDHSTNFSTKGLVALGKRFYTGHIHGTMYTASNADNLNNFNRSHFISVMAVEDNTTINFDMIKPGVQFHGLPVLDDDPTTTAPFSITLDKNETYTVAVFASTQTVDTYNEVNGTRVTSNKNITVHCGSWLGGTESGSDIGSVQPVPVENVGQEYILVKGIGVDKAEVPLVIAAEDNTDIFLNGQTEPYATLNEGEYLAIPASEYSDDDNMYITSTENIFVYQTLGGSNSSVAQTVGLNFIPPLHCVGAKEVNIPFADWLGTGNITVITKAGATLLRNNDPNPITGSSPVPGSDNWVSYQFPAGSGNLNLTSDSVMNVALINFSGNAGTAGYYSGFIIKPVTGLSTGTSGTTPCIPGNASMDAYGFDAYQWYFNGLPIAGATGASHVPQYPGTYSVDGIDLACGFQFRSDDIFIPICESDIGIAKEDVEVVETGSDTDIFDITYRLTLQNYGVSPSNNVQIIEDIEEGLQQGATVEIISMPEFISGDLTQLNLDFDGVNDRKILTGEEQFPIDGQSVIEFTVRVDMTGAVADGFLNQAIFSAKFVGPNTGETGPFTGSDFSTAGLNPDPLGEGDPSSSNDPTITCFYSNNISYSSLVYCQSDENPSPVIDGIFSGIFSGDEGLVISEDGIIDLAASEAGGPYTVTYEVTGMCPAIKTTTVEILAVPNAGSGTSLSTCSSGSDPVELFGLLTGADSGGIWLDEDGNEVSGTFDPSSQEPDEYTFTYRIDNGACDIVESTVTVVVFALPNPGTDGDLTLCESDNAIDLHNILTDEDQGGTWMSDGQVVDNFFDPEGLAGTFVFTYTVENEICEPQSSVVTINVVSVANPGTSAVVNMCSSEGSLNLFDQLGGNPDSGGLWTDSEGNTVSSTFNTNGLSAGEYVLTYSVQNAPCATSTSTVTINLDETPYAGIGNTNVICDYLATYNLNNLFLTEPNMEGSWSYNDSVLSGNVFSPVQFEPGTYQLTYTVEGIGECLGEISESTGVVIIDDCPDPIQSGDEFAIPQGFSPNGDGIGDFWVIPGLEFFPRNTLLVFNRWGAQVYSAGPYQNDWDGKAETGITMGEELPVGTYFYILDLKNGEEPLKGYVYLNR